MTETGIKQDREDEDKVEAGHGDKRAWMNNPDTIYSMSDVSNGSDAGPPGQETSFVLTDHGAVVASKTTARAEAHGKTIKQSGPASTQSNLLERIRKDIEAEIKGVRESDLPTGVKLILIGRAYGRDPEQWTSADKVSNLFIEAVLYSAGIDLPWGFDAVPDYAELKYILGQDRRFKRVFRTDKLRPQESARAFENCELEDGDLAIWASNGRRLSCFLEKAESDPGQKSAYNVLCGGCPDTATGFLYTTYEFYSQTYVQTKDGQSGPHEPTPDVVFRVL